MESRPREVTCLFQLKCYPRLVVIYIGKKMLPKEEYNKSTHRIYLISCSISPFSLLQHLTIQFTAASHHSIYFSISPFNLLQHLTIQFTAASHHSIYCSISPFSLLQHLTIQFTATSHHSVYCSISQFNLLQHLTI